MNLNYNRLKIITAFLLLFVHQSFAKKIKSNNLYNYLLESTRRFQTGETFDVVSIDELIRENIDITIQKCLQDYYFSVEPFPLSSKFPYQGYFKQPFVVYIPEGKVQRALIFCQDKIVKDMFIGCESEKDFLKNGLSKTFRCNGKLAVIAQFGVENYFHWLTELLARLALLEIQGIEYDKLYVPISKPFMKQFLIDIWGIDPSKIIVARESIDFIQADMLIVPCIVSNLMVSSLDNKSFAGHYNQPILMKYVREKILFELKKKTNIDVSNFSKRIFISRKDAPFRKILNEDEIFKLFETKGFKRYVLGEMSVIDQILLFYNAEIIVGEHGAGLTNLLFCKANTKVIELFQALIPIDFWWISRVFDLDYRAIQTVKIDPDLFIGCKALDLVQETLSSRTNILLDEIKGIIEIL